MQPVALRRGPDSSGTRGRRDAFDQVPVVIDVRNEKPDLDELLATQLARATRRQLARLRDAPDGEMPNLPFEVLVNVARAHAAFQRAYSLALEKSALGT